MGEEFPFDVEYAIIYRKIEEGPKRWHGSLKVFHRTMRELNNEYLSEDKVDTPIGKFWKIISDEVKTNYDIIKDYMKSAAELSDDLNLGGSGASSSEVTPILNSIKRVYFFDTKRPGKDRYVKTDAEGTLEIMRREVKAFKKKNPKLA